MKKFITCAIAATAMFAMSAADKTVYNNGQLVAGINVYGWWNNAADFNAANPAGGDTKVFSFKAADGGAAASMGLFADGKTFVTGPLNSATLNFSWYATGTATYTIRLTADGGVEENYTFNVTADNAEKWNSEAVVVNEKYPQVAAEWRDYVGKGAGYVFSVVAENASPDATIYFDNIYYSNLDEAWTAPEIPEIVPPTTVPVIEQPAENVLSVFSAYGNKAFNIGGWGQSTNCENVTIDGKEVVKLTAFNYLGWEFPEHFSIEGYDYMHVDFYPCEQTAFGFTPISPGQEKGWIAPEVKLNEWNRYDAPISYFSNVVLSDIFQIKFDQGSKVECYLANVYFYKSEGGEEPDVPVVPGATYSDKVTGSYTQEMVAGEPKEYPYTLNYAITYNEDKTLTVNAKFDWANGEPVGMIPGAVYINNQPNDFVNENGVRTVTTTETYEGGSKLPVRLFIPVALGIFEVSLPDYVVGSEKSGGDDDPDDPTPDDPVAGSTFTGQVTGEDKISGADGEEVYPYTMKYKIVYNEDKTLTVTAELEWKDNKPVTGLVDGSVFINNVNNAFAMADGIRTVTTADTYTAGETLTLNFFFPRYAGVLEIPVTYVVGTDNTTSISEVKSPMMQSGFYDLRGARVVNPSNGVYIRVENGKATKVFVK